MSRRRRRTEYDDYYDDDRDAERSLRSGPRLLPHVVVLVALFGGGLAAVHYFAGPRMFEKIAQQLASPVGVVWLLLFVSWYGALIWRIKLLSFTSGLAWLLLTVFGNAFVSNELVRRVERPYLAVNPFDGETLDSVLILGGGSDSTPAGIPQLSSRGDRLALAARLFHAGKVRQIVVSGVRWNKPPAGADLYEESATILKELGVPESHIVQLKVGADTSEEIRAFGDWLRESNGNDVATAESPDSAESPDTSKTESTPDRIPGAFGILTSAWHLRRAMLLSDRYGMYYEAKPIPADFLSGTVHRDPTLLIPSADNLQVSYLAIREILGAWFDE